MDHVENLSNATFLSFQSNEAFSDIHNAFANKNNDNKPKLDSIKNIIRTWYFKVPTDLTLRSKHPIYFIHSQNYNFALFPQPTCDISLEYKQHYCSFLK